MENDKTLSNNDSTVTSSQVQERNNSFESIAAVKMQKVYKSYRTRLRLADSAVVAEELWWQAIDYARLNHSTISSFKFLKPESAVSRWSRISLNASKVGKGLCEDSKAQILAFQHWIEAIDPRHRYGHNLNLYYEEWCKADAGQPFFYWLDVGDGKELDLKECPRSRLRQECIRYLGPQEREHHEYIISEGTMVHRQTGDLLDTNEEFQGSKWIFVMSTSKKLYAGKKQKGYFHHSSFLAGGATLTAGGLRAEGGKLRSVSAYSGHYRPSGENLGSFIAFLSENGVNVDKVQTGTSPTEDQKSDDVTQSNEEGSEIGLLVNIEPPKHQVPSNNKEHQLSESSMFTQAEIKGSYMRTLSSNLQSPRARVPKKEILQRIESKKKSSSYQLGNQLSLKWSTGAGPRLGCVADYPLNLRVQALEFVDLSPNDSPAPLGSPVLAGISLSKISCTVM